MCGILLIHNPELSFNNKSLYSLRKRGPDQIGFWTQDNIHIGHTRLSIIGDA